MHYTSKKIITTLGWGGNMTTRFHPPQIPHNSLVHKSRAFIIYLNIILLKSSPISQSISAFVSFTVHVIIKYHRHNQVPPSMASSTWYNSFNYCTSNYMSKAETQSLPVQWNMLKDVKKTKSNLKKQKTICSLNVRDVKLSLKAK